MTEITIPGIELRSREEALHIQSERPLLALSSAVVGGGLTEVQHLFILHVHKNYHNPNPAQDIHDYAKNSGVTGAYLGLMTAVYLSSARTVNLSRGDLQLSALVTAGVSNATSAGLTEPAHLIPPPGTINIILLFSQPLTPAALVNAVITASEAKTDLLRRMEVPTPQGIPATGTSTDAVVAACLQEGTTYRYGGPLTTPGWLAARGVRETLPPQLEQV